MTRRYVSSRPARRGGGRAWRPEIIRARPVLPPPTATLGPGPLRAWLVRSIGEEEVATAREAVDRGAASGALLRAATLRHLEEADHAADMAGGARVPVPRRP